MSRKLYAVYPGHIVARDGDRHFISFNQLCKLYRVDPKLCINMEDKHNPSQVRTARLDQLKILHPQHDPESYKLPES